MSNYLIKTLMTVGWCNDAVKLKMDCKYPYKQLSEEKSPIERLIPQSQFPFPIVELGTKNFSLAILQLRLIMK